MKLKILHLNIERDKHLAKVFELVEQQKPDIICMCEIIETDAKDIAEKFYYKMVYSPLVNSEHGSQGSAIFSKLPILESSNQRYDDKISDELPFIDLNYNFDNGNRPADRFLYHNSVLSIVINNSIGEKITIATTHFPVTDLETPGYEKHTFDETNDIREINHSRIFFDRFMTIIRNLPRPIIFTADLNNPRGNYVYDNLAHELIDLTPKNIETTLDPILHRLKNSNLVVDTIMISPEIKSEDIKIVEGVSDHKALIATLAM